MPYCKKCGKRTKHHKGGERRELGLCHDCYIAYKYGFDDPEFRRSQSLTSREGIAIAHSQYFDGYED